jgi:hypothetical protein
VEEEAGISFILLHPPPSTVSKNPQRKLAVDPVQFSADWIEEDLLLDLKLN